MIALADSSLFRSLATFFQNILLSVRVRKQVSLVPCGVPSAKQCVTRRACSVNLDVISLI